VESINNNQISTLTVVSLIFGIVPPLTILLTIIVSSFYHINDVFILILFVVWGISGIIALITGIISLRKIKTMGLREKGYAIIGILLGLIEILLVAGFIHGLFRSLCC